MAAGAQIHPPSLAIVKGVALETAFVCLLTCWLADLTPATPVHATARTAHGFERPPEVLAAHAVQHEVDAEVGVEQNVADVLQHDQVLQPFVTLGRRLQQSQRATGINWGENYVVTPSLPPCGEMLEHVQHADVWSRAKLQPPVWVIDFSY